jgi:hypothetical protein
LTASAVLGNRGAFEFWCRPLRLAVRRHRSLSKRWGTPIAHKKLIKKFEGTAMEMRHELQRPPDILPAQRASNDLVKRIRKLRWMRMDEEAESLQSQLSLCGVPAADSVVAASGETD